MWNLGLLGAAGGTLVAGAYDLLETAYPSGAETTVVFNNLASAYSSQYKHLQVRYVARSTVSSSLDAMQLILDGDTGSNYSLHYIQGSGSGTPVSLNTLNATNLFVSYMAGNQNSTSWTPGILDFADPFHVNKNVIIRNFSGFSDPNWNQMAFVSGSRRSDSALSSITLKTANNANFAFGTRFSLYGVRD